MRMIAVKQAITMMENAATPHSQYTKITLLTAKKDRSVSLRHQGDELTLSEDGYEKETTRFVAGEGTHDCKHAVKQAFKREFPRSHKVYITAER